MDRERWPRVQALFLAAAERRPEEQRAFVEAGADGDPMLVADVMALLEQDARGDSLLHRGLADVAAGVLDADPAAGLPRDLGPYRLRERLGEGGMGVVFLAERTDLQSLVAIKFLRDAWLSPSRRARFALEQRALARLNHPCIARLYDADVLPDGSPWFAMEFVDGQPLTRWCETRGSSLRHRLALFRSVCEAVLHAHQHALLHRDLKPSNILVTRGGQPKLLDFGIAKPLDRSALSDRTATGMPLLTPAYAAPEQFRGEGLGVHSDIYSLGAILYELATGRAPLEVAGLGPAAAERVVSDQTPERPSVAARRGAERSAAIRALVGEPGGLWADLDVLCLTALEKDPDRRYRSVDALIRDVDHTLRGEPLDARPASLAYRAGKFVRRHRGPVVAGTAGVLVIVALTVYYTVNLARARDAAVAEAERTRRIQRFMNGLFEGGDDATGPSDTLRVVTLLERGVQEAGSLDREPAIQAELHQTLGGIFEALGHLDRADRLQQLALRQRRAELGASHPDVVRSLLALGLLRAHQARLDEADSLVRAGLDLARRRARDDPAAVARATTALGQVLEERGDYDGAIRALEEAARLDSAAGLPAGEASSTLTELANSHFYAGHYAVADSLNRRLLAADRAAYGARHPRVAGGLINLGAVRQEMGDWAGAERYYRQALEIYRGWYGEDHFETAAALNMVGRARVQQGRLGEAREPLARALAVRERIYGRDHVRVASTLNELGLLAQQDGRFEDAIAHFRRMIAIYERAYDGRHFLIGLSLANLGSVHTARGDHAASEALYRRAIAEYLETLPPGHLYVGVARLKLGRALMRQGRFAEGERESRAGYEIVARQPEPAHGWLQNARRDLAWASDVLGRPADAARFRDEMNRASADSARRAAEATASR